MNRHLLNTYVFTRADGQLLRGFWVGWWNVYADFDREQFLMGPVATHRLTVVRNPANDN